MSRPVAVSRPAGAPGEQARQQLGHLLSSDSRKVLMRAFALVLGLIVLGCSSTEPPLEVDPSSQRSLVSGDIVGYAHRERDAEIAGHCG